MSSLSGSSCKEAPHDPQRSEARTRWYISFTQAANENVIHAHSLDTTSAKPPKKVPYTVER